MLSELLKRARYAVGNSLRSASRPWRQWDISPQEATTLFGCSFGLAGWHHLRQTLAQFEADPGIEPRHTVLWRFLKDFCPRSVFDLAGAGPVSAVGPFVFPWGGFRPSEALVKDPWKSRFCGPSTDDFVHAELQRTLHLFQQMKTDGYQPMVFPNTFVGGVWLIAEDGGRRFLVLQGNHRMAVLAHLGVQRMAVRALRGHHVYIRVSEAASWPMVKTGACTLEQARAVFAMYFRENGFHVARLLGLDRDVAVRSAAANGNTR